MNQTDHMTADPNERADAVSLGDFLRSERELRGIALEDVRKVTRVQLSYLKLIEADDYEHLPADVYARGYIRAYARFLGLDVADCIARYEHHVPPLDSALDLDALAPPPGIERPDSSMVIEHVGSTQTGGRGGTRRNNAASGSSPRRGGLALVLVVLLLAVLAILFVYFTNRPSKPPTENKAPSTTETATFDKAG